MDNLKPCPFCGGEPTLYQDEMTGNWAVRCVKDTIDTIRPTVLNSHGATAWGYSCIDQAAAIEAWNTRANDTLAAENDVTADGGGVTTRTCHQERTCEYVGDEISGGCSECRGWLDPACAYCPNCGAKVVDDGGQ